MEEFGGIADTVFGSFKNIYKVNVGFSEQLNTKYSSWQLLFLSVIMNIKILLTLSIILFTITAEILGTHWLIFIVNKWTNI